MPRVLLLAVVASGLVLAVAAGPAAARTACTSGETVYKRGAARIFKIVRGNDDHWLACRSRTARPVLLYVADGGLANFGVELRQGRKLVFGAVIFGENGSAHQLVGWFDTRTGRARSGALADDDEAQLLDVAIGRDGGIALVARLAEEDSPRAAATHVGYLPVARTRGQLEAERRLSSAGPDYVKGSLVLGAEDVSWRSGAESRTVPLTGEPATCTAGTTLLAVERVRLFEVLQPRRHRGLLLGCGAGASTPTTVASQDIDQLWRVRAFARVGSRIPFRAGEDGIGLLDGVAGQFRFGRLSALTDLTSPTGTPSVLEIAAVETGPVAFAAETDRRQQYVGVLPLGAAASRFETQRRLATVAEPLVPGSLAVRDGRLHWRDAQGDRSVGLGGEGELSCASGTTLHDRAGTRLFETLDPAEKKARLFGCQPGSTAPVALTTSGISVSWNPTLVTSGNGRALVWASVDAGDHVDEIVTFAPAVGTARAGFVHSGSHPGHVRDSVVAADGSAALVYRPSGKNYRIAYLALGADPARLQPERRLKTVTDGFQAGSLALTDSSVTWRNAAGDARSTAF